MYSYSLLFQLTIIILVTISLIDSINFDFGKKGLILKDIFKYRRNPEKNGEIEKLKADEESHKNKFNSSNIEAGSKESQLEDRLSRVELVFGSSGLKLLNRSNVLVLGANELSSKIITHLIRSGVSSVTLWDCDKNLEKDKLEEIRILNPDCNIKGIHTDPEEYIKEGDYSTVIFANRPITEAIKYDNKFHGKCNFVYAFAAGTYGLVINDFGKHEIRVKSDHSHQEHTCKLVYSGKESCLEVTGSNVYDYKRNDVVQVKYTQKNSKSRLKNKNKSELSDRSVVIDTYKIVNVDRTDRNIVRIWIETGRKRLPKNIVSVKKVDEKIELEFSKIEDLLSKLLETRKLKTLIRSISDRVFSKRGIDKLVISPSCNNRLNNSSLSVLASFVALNRAKLCNLKGDLDSRNFYDLTKEAYSMADYEAVSNFNELRDLKIPAMTTLIGALAAQEAMKGITKMFTPTDMILVDRSDIFTLKNSETEEYKKSAAAKNKHSWNLKENAKKSIDDVNGRSFLLIGAGALGCEYLRLLAEMKVSRVAVVDNDTVETSNLSRQSLFTQNDVGSSKAQSAVNNLKLLHDTEQYVGYNMMFTEGVYGYFKSQLGGSRRRGSTVNGDKRIGQKSEMDNWVGISAVDNIEGRLALDGFCTQNRMPLVESGIYGMQCSTSITVPYVTESFSSSVSGESFKGRYSCSVKGVPENIDDCIFYSVELFSWLFNGQNVMLRSFLRDPVRAVELALERGSNYFYTLLGVVNDYLLIIKDPMSNRHAKHMQASENVEIRKWALRTYERYVGHDTEHKNALVKTLSNLKLKSLKEFYPYSGNNVNKLDARSFDCNKLKSLISQGYILYEFTTNTGCTSNIHSKGLDRNSFFAELDRYIRVVNNSTTGSCKDDDSKMCVSSGSDVGSDDSAAKVMVLEEGCEDCVNFIYRMSNARANKFKIPESDRVSVVKKAKNIVPAVSTCVSTAASLSFLELYKLALFSRLDLHKDPCGSSVNIRIEKVKHECTPCSSDDDAATEVVLNNKVTLRYLVEKDEIDFYNKGKKIFKIYPHDYGRNESATRYFNNYYFNTATLKFVSNIANKPEVYTINNERSILNSISLSYWDYIYVDDHSKQVDRTISMYDYDDSVNVASTSNSTGNGSSNLFKSKIIGRVLRNKILTNLFRKENEFLKHMLDNEVRSDHNFIYLYELVDLIEYVFDVTVDALTFQHGYVILNNMNRARLLKDVVSERLTATTPTPSSRTSSVSGTSTLSLDTQGRDLILHIIARDKRTNESMELPDIQYRF